MMVGMLVRQYDEFTTETRSARSSLDFGLLRVLSASVVKIGLGLT